MATVVVSAAATAVATASANAAGNLTRLLKTPAKMPEFLFVCYLLFCLLLKAIIVTIGRLVYSAPHCLIKVD
jgi:hypothetical protein